jgi:hypothetical protein
VKSLFGCDNTFIFRIRLIRGFYAPH